MRISEIQSRISDGQVEISGVVSVDCAPSKPFPVWMRFPAEFGEPQALGDPFAAAFLLTSMFDREDLHVEAPVSAKLVNAFSHIQYTYSSWYPRKLARTHFSCAETVDRSDEPRATGVGCLFSGGVDSWYSVLANQERITHLVMVRGFDILERNAAIWDMATETAQAVAAQYGKSLVLMETNVRQLTDKSDPLWGHRADFDFWGPVSCGSTLATMGLCLGHVLGELIIPSSYSIPQIAPWGSHPLTDPLFTTERVRVTHDSCRPTRMDKVAALARCPLAMRTLRVCWRNEQGAYNCCRCEKCRRTMLALAARGALGNATSFHLPLDLHGVMRADRPKHGWSIWYREILDLAESRGETKIAEAIRVLLGDRFSLERTFVRAEMWLKRFGKRMIHRRIWQALTKAVEKGDH